MDSIMLSYHINLLGIMYLFVLNRNYFTTDVTIPIVIPLTFSMFIK